MVPVVNLRAPQGIWGFCGFIYFGFFSGKSLESISRFALLLQMLKNPEEFRAARKVAAQSLSPQRVLLFKLSTGPEPTVSSSPTFLLGGGMQTQGCSLKS